MAEDQEAQATGVDHEIVKSVAGTNFKVLGDLPAILAGQMVQNAISHQARIQSLSETALASSHKRLSEVDPAEAKSLETLFTGNAVSKQLADLGASVAALQQMMKGAQTTPPPTA